MLSSRSEAEKRSVRWDLCPLPDPFPFQGERMPKPEGLECGGSHHQTSNNRSSHGGLQLPVKITMQAIYDNAGNLSRTTHHPATGPTVPDLTAPKRCPRG